MNKSKLVSCIVPVLNERETIQDFIMSLHKQDYRPIELIIVDGGSRDDTIKIINTARIELNDENFSIYLFQERDFGIIASPANARNIGLHNASGDFILFIDSDTCFTERSTISAAVSEMGDRDFIIIFFTPLIDTKLEEYISKIMELRLDGVVLYRKKLIEKRRFIPTLGFGEDREFNYRLFGDFGFPGQVPCSATIGRHYPHTWNELRKQNEWYGRTIVNYLKVMFFQNKKEFLLQGIYVAYNILLAILPIAILIGFVISIKFALILIFLLFAQVVERFIKYGYNTLDEFVFLLWYLIFSGGFFAKGLISNIYRKNSIGRI